MSSEAPGSNPAPSRTSKRNKKSVDSLENQRSVEEKLVLEEDVGDEELRQNHDLLRKKGLNDS